MVSGKKPGGREYNQTGVSKSGMGGCGETTSVDQKADRQDEAASKQPD